MSYINLGTASQLTIKVPVKGFTGWADTMRTDTFLKIAEHDHTGSGKGTQIATGAIAADAITGAKIRLDNNEYLKGRNAANNANISIIKVNTSDKLALGAELANLDLINNISIQFRNAANSAYIAALKVNSSDKIELGADLAGLSIVNNTFFKGRNAADSAYIDIIKVNASNKLELGAETTGISMTNNTAVKMRNAADSAYIDAIKVNASDKLELGASVVSVTTEALTTPSVTANGSVTLTDNTAVAADASIITLSANQFCKIFYKIIRNTDQRVGEIELDQSNGNIIETYSGDSCGVTFSLASDILKYTTTSTGNNATVTYTLVKG